MAGVLFTLGLDWGLPNHHSWNADDVSPWKPLSLPWRYFESFDKYPYPHWMLSWVAYLPYLLWLRATGGLEAGCLPSIVPEDGCFADPFGSPAALMWISRALSVGMALGCVVAVYALVRVLHPDRRAALFAALAAALSAALVAYAHVGNLDVPHVFWFAVSLVFYARVFRDGSLRDHLGFGLATGCALATKESIAGASLGACLAVYALHLVRARRAGQGLLGAHLDRRLWAVAAAVLGIYAVGTNPLLNFDGFVEHLRLWLPGGERMAGYREEGFQGWTHFALLFGRQARAAMGTPLLLLGLAGAIFCSIRHPRTAILWVPLLAYLLLSVVPSSMTRIRFLLPAVLILAAWAGIAAAALSRAGSPLRWATVALLAAVYGHAFLHSLNVDLHYLRDGRYAAESWWARNLPPDARPGVWRDGSGLPRFAWLGVEVEVLERDARVADRLALDGPDLLVVSSSYPGPFRGSRRAALARLASGELGYRVLWRGQGETPLDAWFANPFGWIDPEVVVLAREASAAR